MNGARVTRAGLVNGDSIAVGDTVIGFAAVADAAQVPQTPPDQTPPPVSQTPQTPTIHTPQRPAAQTVAQTPQAPQSPQAPVAQPPQTPQAPAHTPAAPSPSERQSPPAARREQRAAERGSGVSQTPPRTPPERPRRTSGASETPPNVNQPAGNGGGGMKWVLAIAALVIAGVVGAAYMGLLPIPLPLPGVEDKPVGTEVARHVHGGTEYVIVDYAGELAVFKSSGAAVGRSAADAVLHSYAWRQQLADFDADKLADVARTVRDIDDQVSEVREYTGEVVAIFDELDGMGADVPLLGRVSAMDAVREYYAGVGEAESLIRSLDSELGSFGDNAVALTRASERVEGVQLASVSGAEMERLFMDAADAARDLVSAASNLNSQVSRARDAAGRLEGALRDASDTPLIGGAIGGFADSASRLESELSGVQDALGGFESEVAALGRDLRGAMESANSARQSDMARWIGEPYDASWPPSDPGRRSAAAKLPAAPGRQPSAAAVAKAAVPTATAVATSTAVPTATATPVPAPQINQFEPISAGFYHTCGLREDGAVECWGYNRDGESSPPGGRFAAVSAGSRHTCGLREDGAVDCWGWNEYGQSSPPGGRFVAISAGDAHACGLREDGAVECWGYDEYGQASPPGGRFVSVSAGHTHSCGIREDGTVDCWGGHAYYYGFPTLPDGRFTAISALNHTCGIREDSAVECWGYNEDGQASPPGGRFAAVSAGLYHTCGLREDGTAECWGEDTYADETSPPGGRFAAVSAGRFHTCGLREDGAVECWGYNHYGESSPPGGRFAVP